MQRVFRKVTVLLISLSLGFVPSAYASQNENHADREGSPTAKIVGGSEIPISDAPWQVALISTSKPNNFQGQFCGGSVISTEWIVTAAHCLVDGATITDKSEFLVLAGNADLSQTGPVSGSTVKKILINPEWNSNTFEGDIALIQLTTPLSLTTGQIEKIKLPSTAPAEGTPAKISGWGSRWFSDGVDDYPELSGYNQKWPTALQGATVYINSNSTCSSELGGAFLMYSMLCAGIQDYLVDSCQGDSGGPLATTSGGLWYLSGIVSSGYGCAWTTPGIYTNVEWYTQWIYAQTLIDVTLFNGTSGIVPCETSGSVTGAGYITIEQKVLTSNNGCTGGVNIPEGVTSIDDAALDESKMISLAIPATLTTLPDVSNSLFAHDGLESITVASGNPNYSAADGVLFNKNKSLLIFYPEGKAGSTYVIPASVTTIGDFAFYSAELSGITIPTSVTSISSLSFYGASLVTSFSVSLSNSAYSASGGVLFNKNGTTLVEYPDAKSAASYSLAANVSRINEYAFSGVSALNSVSISANVTVIDPSAFYSAISLSQISVASGNPNYSSVEGVLFNKSTTALLAYPISKSGSSYIVPANVTSLGEYAFNLFMDFEVEPSSLESVYFLGNAPTAGAYTFSLPNGSKAYKNPSATGFTTDGSGKWNDLILLTGYSVTYDSNGASSGTAPNDSIPMYGSGESVSVLSNSGQLAKTNYIFSGWNTASNGTGTTYEASGSDSFIIGAQSVKLYATWSLDPAYVAAQDAAAKAQADAAAKAQADAAAKAQADAAAQAVAAELASRTVGAKKKFAAKSLAQQTGVVIVSPKAKVTFKVAKSSKKVCTKSGSKLKTLAAGTCVVTFTVQEPKPKKGKKPKATKTVKTFVVQ